MKHFSLALFFILSASVGLCISIEEVGRLAELKTDEELILQIVYKEGIDRRLTSKDVIYLRERGVSEKIIDYVWKHSFQDKEFLPPQEGESTMIGENLRSYQGRDKSGNKIVVLTNLDENGRPMGPPPPPAPEPERQPYPQTEVTYVPQQPQPIYVTATNQQPAWAIQEEDIRSYQSQPFANSVFSNGYYPYYPFTFSYFPVAPYPKPHCFFGKGSGHRTSYSPVRGSKGYRR